MSMDTQPKLATNGPLALSLLRRKVDYLKAVIEVRHPELMKETEWQMLAGLAQEPASDVADLEG